MTLYFNTTQGPFVYDDEGHSVGGGEWVDTEITDQIRRGLDRGVLHRITANVAEKQDDIPVVEVPDDEPKKASKK